MDSKGIFVTDKPRDPNVARHIAYYYFHKSDDAAFQNKFIFYPNYKHALTVYKNSDTLLNGHGSEISASKEEKFTIFYTVNIDKNLNVSLNGAFDKIGIVFNPMGINHFIDVPLSDIFTPFVAELSVFGTAFEEILLKVYQETDAELKIDLLDNFFKQRLIAFDEPILKRAVAEILNSNGAIRVEELSDLLNVNRKTLLRLFKKHLCCSVEEYKKLVMFRNALNFSQQGELLSLTDVALYNLYYDQAHFIKQFKSITKLSPKTLLSKITKLGNQEVYWNFDD